MPYTIKRDYKHAIEPEEILMDQRSQEGPEANKATLGRLESIIVAGNIKILLILTGLILLALLSRTAYLQIYKNKYYIDLSENNRTRYVLKTAPRGNILDRYGLPLLENQPSYSLVLVPADLPYDLSEVEAILKSISEIFNLDITGLKKEITAQMNSEDIDPILIKTNLDVSEVRIFESEIKDKKGFSVREDISRNYISGPVFSQVLGYVGKMNSQDIKIHPTYPISETIGKAGLEAVYDQNLRGQSSKQIYEVDAQGKIIHDLGETQAVPGLDLTTTIDKEMQLKLYTAMTESMDNLGITKGAGIIINPKTGEILSLVSFPSYDNNLFIKGGPKEKIDKILNDQAWPLLNRVVSGLYAPGSTIKPLVALAALQEGVISKDRKISDGDGRLIIPNPYHPELPSIFVDNAVHGMVDVFKALAYSCNVYFYEVGGGYGDIKGLGIAKLKEYWQKFYLDKLLGIDLPGEKKGVLPDVEWIKENRKNDPLWRLGDTYNVSIGQGDLSITPLSLISYIAAIANNGVLMKPHLIKKIGVADEESKEEIITNLPVSAENLKAVQEGMRQVVTLGSARSLTTLKIDSAGKTGTPQIQGNKKINALFVGYAPYQNPEIAWLILLEEPKLGSTVAIPVAFQMLSWYEENRWKGN